MSLITSEAIAASSHKSAKKQAGKVKVVHVDIDGKNFSGTAEEVKEQMDKASEEANSQNNQGKETIVNNDSVHGNPGCTIEGTCTQVEDDAAAPEVEILSADPEPATKQQSSSESYYERTNRDDNISRGPGFEQAEASPRKVVIVTKNYFGQEIGVDVVDGLTQPESLEFSRKFGAQVRDCNRAASMLQSMTIVERLITKREDADYLKKQRREALDKAGNLVVNAHYVAGVRQATQAIDNMAKLSQALFD
jgi:hypothetical protein